MLDPTDSTLSPVSLLRHVTDVNSPNTESSASTLDTEKNKVANPPARTIRFDGHEIVLGNAESQPLSTDQLLEMLEPLVKEDRAYSASLVVERFRESSERLLAERWATSANDPVVKLVANVLSKRSNKPESSWNALLRFAKEQPNTAKHYLELRNAFASDLQSKDPSDDAAAQLQQAALKVAHPLVRVDALRLLGLRELVADRHAWSESLCRQSVEIANQAGNPLLAAEMGLMVAEAARRSEQPEHANKAWIDAVNLHLANCKRGQSLDVSFWLLAEHIRPESQAWPDDLADAMNAHCTNLGLSSEDGTEVLFWSAIAQTQLERSEMQQALINFKKAETLATGNNKMWLRVAQSKCLAGMGQTPAAAAILSGPAACENVEISTPRPHHGKHQASGWRLPTRNTTPPQSTQPIFGIEWPTKNQAKADLALAQLIIGDSEPGLQALHEVQSQLEKSGERRLLIQSLNNELRLLEHERRDSDIALVKSRIAQLERVQ